MALVAIKFAISGAGLPETVMLLPFFFSVVPVLTFAFGEGLYMWNKNRMRFELYDSEEHPILSKVYFGFFLAMAITSTVFLLAFSGAAPPD